MINLSLPFTSQKGLVLDHIDETTLAARLAIQSAKCPKESYKNPDFGFMLYIAEQLKLKESQNPDFDGSYSDRLTRIDYYYDCLQSFHSRHMFSPSLMNFFQLNAERLPVQAITQYFIPTAYDLSVLLEDFTICDMTKGYSPEEFVVPPTLVLSEQTLESMGSNPLGVILLDVDEYLLFYLPAAPDSHLLKSLLGRDCDTRLHSGDTHLSQKDDLLTVDLTKPGHSLTSRLGALIYNLQTYKYFKRIKVVPRHSNTYEEWLINNIIHCYGSWHIPDTR